jgi:anti-anti-sigma regulatory factor
VLRVTRYSENSARILLKVEGRVAEDWVGVLKMAIDAELRSPALVELDFTDVDYIDAAGVRMLHDTFGDNLPIAHCPEWVRTQLDQKPARD